MVQNWKEVGPNRYAKRLVAILKISKKAIFMSIAQARPSLNMTICLHAADAEHAPHALRRGVRGPLRNSRKPGRFAFHFGAHDWHERDRLFAESHANLGMDEVKFTAPVFAGIRCMARVKCSGSAKANRGQGRAS